MFENRNWCPKWHFVVLLLFCNCLIKGKKLSEEDDILEQVIPHAVERRKFTKPHTAALSHKPKRGFLPDSALTLQNGINVNGVLPPSFSQQLAQADDQNIHAANEGSNIVQDLADQSESTQSDAAQEANQDVAQDAAQKQKAPAAHEAGDGGQDFFGSNVKPPQGPPNQASADINQYGLWEYGLDDTKGDGVDDSSKANMAVQYAQQTQDQTQEQAQKIPGMEQGGVSQVVDANKMASILGNDININGAKIGSDLDSAEQLLAQQANEQNNAGALPQSSQISEAANAAPEADATGGMGTVTEGGAVAATSEAGMPMQNNEAGGPGAVSVVSLPNAMTIEDEHGNVIKPFTTNAAASNHHNGKMKSAALQSHNSEKVGDSSVMQGGVQQVKVIGNALNGASQGESFMKDPAIANMMSSQQNDGTAKDNAHEQHNGGENKESKLLKIIKNLLKSENDQDAGRDEVENKEIMELIHHLRKERQKPDGTTATNPSNAGLKVAKANDAAQVKQETATVTSPLSDQPLSTPADAIKEDADIAQLEAMINGGKNGNNKGSKSVFYDPEMPLGDPGTGTNQGLMDYLEQETAYVNQIQEGSQSSDPHKQLLHIAKLLLMHKTGPHAPLPADIDQSLHSDPTQAALQGNLQNVSTPLKETSALTFKTNESHSSTAASPSPPPVAKLDADKIKSGKAASVANSTKNVNKENAKGPDNSKANQKVDNTNSKPANTLEKGKSTENGKTTEIDKTVESGKVAENGKTEEKEKTAENGKASESRKPAESGKVTENGKTGEIGKTTEGKMAPENGKLSENEKIAENGKVSENEKIAENGKTAENGKVAENGKITENGKVHESQKTSADGVKTLSENEKEMKQQSKQVNETPKEANAGQHEESTNAKEPVMQDSSKEANAQDYVKKISAANEKNETTSENEGSGKLNQENTEMKEGTKENNNSVENILSNPHPDKDNSKETSTENEEKDNEKISEKPAAQNNAVTNKISETAEEQPLKNPSLKGNNIKSENKQEDVQNSVPVSNLDTGKQADLSNNHEPASEPSDSHDKYIDNGVGSEVSSHVLTPLKETAGRLPDGMEPKFKEEGPTVSQIGTSPNGQTVIKETFDSNSNHLRDSANHPKDIHPEKNEDDVNVKETEVVRKLPGLPLTNPGAEHYEVPVRTLKVKPFSRYHTYTGDDGQVSRVLNSQSTRSSTSPTVGSHSNRGFLSMSAINGREHAGFEGPSTLTSLHSYPSLRDVSPSTRSLLSNLYQKKSVPFIPSSRFGLLPATAKIANENTQGKDELPSSRFKNLLSDKLKNLFGRQAMSASAIMSDESRQIQKSRTASAAKKSIQDLIDSLRKSQKQKMSQSKYPQASFVAREQDQLSHHSIAGLSSMASLLSNYRKPVSTMKDTYTELNKKVTHPQSSFGMIIAKSSGPETTTNLEVGVDPMDVTRSRLAHKPLGPSIADVLFRLGEVEKHSNISGNHAKSAIRNVNSIAKVEVGKSHLMKGSIRKSASKKSQTESTSLKPRSLDAMLKKLREDKNLSSLLLKRRTIAVDDKENE